MTARWSAAHQAFRLDKSNVDADAQTGKTAVVRQGERRSAWLRVLYAARLLWTLLLEVDEAFLHQGRLAG